MPKSTLWRLLILTSPRSEASRDGSSAVFHIAPVSVDMRGFDFVSCGVSAFQKTISVARLPPFKRSLDAKLDAARL